MPDSTPGPIVDAGRNGDGADQIRADRYAFTDEDSNPEFFGAVTLLDNHNNAGMNPHQRPTQSQPRRRLPTIGTRGQERGET